MKDSKIEIVVTLVDVNDFIKKYPRFSTFVNNEGNVLFDAIVTPGVFVDASVLANYGYPSVLSVAQQCQEIIEKTEGLDANSFTKQFIGSVICSLMEANGYKKTGTKKSVPHKLFTTGEFYEQNFQISRIESVNLCGSARLSNLTPIDQTIVI